MKAHQFSTGTSVANFHEKNCLDDETWLREELSGCLFKDVRLKKRFQTLVNQLFKGLGESLPFACQDWANTKAAYRFLSNDRVSEREIMGGHFKATRNRFAATQGPILILQDTTELSYQRERPECIGSLRLTRGGDNKENRPRPFTVCGMLMHSSLAVTTAGLPLGLAAIKFWTRKKFKGANALKKKVNPTRVAIEEKESIRWLDNLKQSTQLFKDPDRCIHIGDRESDIYELFCTAHQEGTHFLVRTCVDRLVEEGTSTIGKEMKKVHPKGSHPLKIRNRKGEECEVILEITYHRLKVLPPIGKSKKYPALYLSVIYAQETKEPENQDRERIVWKLITDLSIHSLEEAIEKLEWYAMRWKIETFHKILKSGCKAESSKIRTAERLVNLIAIFCILSWRIFWMTMMNRLCPQANAKIALTSREISLLNHLIKAKEGKEVENGEWQLLSHCLVKLAKLGGYLGRTKDPPPGNIVIWRGMSRLADIELGFKVAMQVVGN
jgi:hypothetical protein